VTLALLAAGTAGTHRVSAPAMRWTVAGLALALVASSYISAQAMRAESHIVRSVHILNLLVQHPELPTQRRQALQDQAFTLLQEGAAINPHYRKIISLAADQFAATGNLPAALWAQDTVAASRPHIPDVHANRVLLNSSLRHPEAAQAALTALTALQPDAPRTRAMGILLLRRTGQDAQAAEQLRTYFAQGTTDYDLVRFAMVIALALQDEALAVQAYHLWVQGWPGETQGQTQALKQAPPAWRSKMQAH
jgi:hypothetical protein